MNKIEHLLACVGEECGEVQQVVGKSLRFGIYDHHPKRDNQPNVELLRLEVHDILATYEMVMDELGLDKSIDRGLIQLKKQRVIKHMRGQYN